MSMGAMHRLCAKMRRKKGRVIATTFLLFVGMFALGSALWGIEGVGAEPGPATALPKDIYFQSQGEPIGPSAPSAEQTVYGTYGSLDNRLLVWFVTQQHTYFGGFVLALPIFCLIFEFIGLGLRDRSAAAKYDRMARDFLKVSLLAFSMTAIAGAVMLGLFITLYPSFMAYMGGTFRDMMPVYAFVFLAESFCLVTYYYSWDRLIGNRLKWVHAALGVMTNVFGALLLFLANAWAAFMMAPAGIDEQGRYLGNVWHLLNSALWNPLNAHRFLADLMLGGSVVMAYASYRFLTAKKQEERAYYDWVGYVFLLVTVCALLPMPFAGYWLMKAVYSFRQSMGMTMMGGLLTWLFVVQAVLVGALFLGVNYYLWQAMGRVQGGERYEAVFKALVIGLAICLLVWLTPHTMVMTPTEIKAIGGAQHPVIGNYGVMSAKNGAINVMICLTGLSYILYRRANRMIPASRERIGNAALAVLFGAGIANIVWLAVYGFSLPANVRVGLSYPQALTTFTVIAGGLLINRATLAGAPVRGPVTWGNISVRGMVTLFGLAAAFTWVMGLMGYIRSSGRLSWHINEVMPDVSPWAFTPSLAFASKMVTLNMVVFWLSALALFWLASRERKPTPVEESEAGARETILQSASREVQPS